MEDGVKKGQELGQKIEEFPSGDLARSLKEKSKKWQNFLAQVHFCTLKFFHVKIMVHAINLYL